MLDAVNKAEAAGYQRIYKVERDNNEYEMEALDKDGKQVELKVNASTGAISKELK